MRMCVLASGSAGNCTVVRIGARTLMIDAGLGPRTTAHRLSGTGLSVRQIHALLLTHLDHDHFKPTWFATLRRLRIPVYLHRRHVHAFYRANETEALLLHRAGLLNVFDDHAFVLTGGGECSVSVTPLRGEHDRNGVVSYRIDCQRGRLLFATDLGRVSDALVDAMTDVHLLAVESNYDPPMQLASTRPIFLKRRIMGGCGHLSNEQAFEAVCRAIARSRRPPHHVVLLHLSRQCNCPTLARRTVAAHPKIADRLCISSQSEPTPWLSVRPAAEPLVGEQMMMFA